MNMAPSRSSQSSKISSKKSWLTNPSVETVTVRTLNAWSCIASVLLLEFIAQDAIALIAKTICNLRRREELLLDWLLNEIQEHFVQGHLHRPSLHKAKSRAELQRAVLVRSQVAWRNTASVTIRESPVMSSVNALGAKMFWTEIRKTQTNKNPLSLPFRFKRNLPHPQSAEPQMSPFQNKPDKMSCTHNLEFHLSKTKIVIVRELSKNFQSWIKTDFRANCLIAWNLI